MSRALPGRADGGALAVPDGARELAVGRRWSAARWRVLRLVACPEVAEPLEPGQVRVGVRAGGLNFRDVLSPLGFIQVRRAWVVRVRVSCWRSARSVEGSRCRRSCDGFAAGCVWHRRGRRPSSAGARCRRVGPSRRRRRCRSCSLTAYYALVDLARSAGGLSGCWCTPGPVVWGWRRCSSPGIWGPRCSRLPARGSGARCGSWGWTRRTSPPRARLEFGEQFLQQTGGEGVDVVLNSLAGEFVDASLELLPRGGRFVEMGKTDVRDRRGRGGLTRASSYRAFDLLEAGPERIQEMLGEVMELFEQGVLRPCRSRAWDVRRAPEAFRHVSQARHVGKIVLTLPSCSARWARHRWAMRTGLVWGRAVRSTRRARC